MDVDDRTSASSNASILTGRVDRSRLGTVCFTVAGDAGSHARFGRPHDGRARDAATVQAACIGLCQRILIRDSNSWVSVR
jgi:hypothetical protein